MNVKLKIEFKIKMAQREEDTIIQSTIQKHLLFF